MENIDLFADQDISHVRQRRKEARERGMDVGRWERLNWDVVDLETVWKVAYSRTRSVNVRYYHHLEIQSIQVQTS